jgi:hypothetical protein
LTEYADISVLDSSPILGIARDKSSVFHEQEGILGGKSRNDCSKFPHGLIFHQPLLKNLTLKQ